MFAITRFHYIEVLLHMFYNDWGKKLLVIWRFVISRFLCSSDLFYGFRWFSLVLQAQTGILGSTNIRARKRKTLILVVVLILAYTL